MRQNVFFPNKMSYIWSEMKKEGKIKPYTPKESSDSELNEAAPQYESLKVILGGNKAIGKSVSGDFGLIALTRQGVRKSSLKSLARYLGINMETLSSLLHTSYRNIQRKDDNDLLDSLKSEKVLELASFAHRGIQVIGDSASFAEWLQSPLMALDNKSPLDYLDTSFGIQLLLKLLGRLEQGVYS